jgi:uncharacterized protein YacL
MGISDLFYAVFAVGVFHTVVAGIYYVGVRRSIGERPAPRVRALVRRTLAASVGLVVAYLTAALLAFQLLPVSTGYPLFVAAWVVYGALLMCLFGISQRRVQRLHAVGSQLAFYEPADVKDVVRKAGEG